MEISKKYSALIKIIWVILIITLLVLLEKVSAAPYSDVPTGSWYEQVIQNFKNEGLLYRVRTIFNPSGNAIRADFMQLILDAQGGITRSTPSTPSFNDALGSEWFYSYIEEAARLGWVKGDGNCYGSKPCNARPYGNINRAEAAALLVRAFGFEQTKAAPHFIDNQMGQWYTNIIQTSADHCILQGDDSTSKVRPADFMNRAEMVAMIDRARNRQTYGVDCGKIQEAVHKISEITSIAGNKIAVDFNTDLNGGSVLDTLRYRLVSFPDIIVTNAKHIRPQGVELTFSKDLIAKKNYTLGVNNMVTANGKLFSDTLSFIGYTIPQPSESTLTLAAVNVNASKLSIPRGAMRVPMLTVDFTASCDSGLSLDDIMLTREGMGSKTDIDGIYAVVNGERVSRKRTIDAKNNTVSLHFTKSIIIPACSSKRVEFVADMASGAASSGEHRLSIKTAVDIVTNAKKIQTSYPIRGGEFTVAAVTTGTANLEYRTVSPSEVKVGDKSVALGKLSLSSNSLESHTLVNVMFKQDGSLKAGDIENIRIRRTNGEVLSNSIKKMTTDYVLLTFSSPLILKQGDNISLELIADIIGGAGRTIQFMVEEDSDFFVKGSAYGQNNNYGSRVSVSPKTTPALVAVDAGGFVLETDGPSQQNYANDTRGALLANIMMTSGDEPASIRSMYILVQAQTVAGLGMGSGSGADDEISELVKNIRLRNSSKGTSVSGVRLSGANDSLASTQKTYQIYRFDNFNVRGKENWMLEVDFINNGTSRHPLSGDKFRVHICGEPTQIKSTNGTFPTTNTTGCDFAGLLSSRSTAYQMRIEGLSTGDTITDVRPRGSISGNFHSIALAALTISQQSAGTSDITVRGAKDVSLMRYEVRAGSTKDILLTRLSFEAVAGSLQNGQNYTLWVDTNNDSKVDTVLQSGAAPQGNILTFSKLSGGGYVVKASKMTVFELHSNITSSPLSNSLQVGFASGVSNYIEAEQIDGSTLSGIRTNGSCIDTCDISITTNNSLLWTILSQGNLFVGQSTTPIRRMQILGGELSDPILRLVFRADNEPIDVTDIQIISAQSKASSIERLELFKNDAVTPFAIATTSGCGNSNVISTHNGIPVSTFCAKMNSQQFVVQPSADSTVLVRTRVKTDTNGGIPNDIIQLWVAGQTSGNIQSIKGRGTASSTNLIVNNGDNSGQGEIIIGRNSFGANADITGPEHRVVMSKINSIVNASIDSNNTAIPVGTSDIGQFAFTAAQNSNSKNGNNEVAIDNIIFTVNSSNVAIDAESLRIVRQGDSSIEHPCDAIASDGTALSGTINGIFLASCSDLISSAFSERIAKNSTAVFALRANVTNPSLGKSSTLQVSLQNYSDATKSFFGATGSHIEWMDKDGVTSQRYYWTDLKSTAVNSTTYRN